MIKLPKSISHNAIMVYVDRLIKIRHFISIINEIIAEGTANLFVTNVYKLHSFPSTIVSNRGP